MCGEPANSHGWKEPGFLQTAVLTDLEPSTKYYYRYGSDESGWSPEYSFVSAPVTSAQSGIRLAAYGGKRNINEISRLLQIWVKLKLMDQKSIGRNILL